MQAGKLFCGPCQFGQILFAKKWKKGGDKREHFNRKKVRMVEWYLGLGAQRKHNTEEILKQEANQMRLRKTLGLCLMVVFMAFTMTPPSIAVGQAQKASEKWLSGDFHQHTYFTDGSWTMNDLDATGQPVTSAMPLPLPPGYKQGVVPTGYRFGLDFQANSEHGGRFGRDGFGKNWTTYSPNPIIGDGAGATAANMWRWQSLISTSDTLGYTGASYLGAFDWLTQIRVNYPDKVTMTGMEWNVPGHEHCSTGIVAEDALPIAEFEYLFDNNDSDGTLTTATATIMGWTGKKQNSDYTVAYPVLGLNATHEKAIDAVKWMQQNYPKTGWIIPAHVERRGCGGIGNQGYTIAAFRDMNDNGPTVAFGFEGIPGHQKSSQRGEFGDTACGNGSYGGAGIYIAQVGGLWDNLLADGRRFFNFASSDFHDTRNDFWPGEYQKTYVKVKDGTLNNGTFTQEDVVNGLRSGNAFSVNGDLINELDFRVFHGNSVKNQSGTNSATMGETLSVGKGEKITVQIRFKSPESNNCEAGVNASSDFDCENYPPVVHHVQLIQGRINPTRAPKFLPDGVTPNPVYNAIDNTVANIVETFDASSWNTDAEGFTTMTYTVQHVRQDMFFRIRGTNLGYGVVKMDATNSRIVYGTDAIGNPLRNTPGTNNADMAWQDLWFYSTPIFVSVR